MKDKLIRGTAKNGEVRIIAALTTELVSEGARIHKCSATAAAALGRMLTAGALMGVMLKSDNGSLTIKISGGGEANGVVVTAHADASVKGFIGNPLVDLPASPLGKLDVGRAIGKTGNLSVVMDMGFGEPYSSSVPIATGEIGDDIAYYYTTSEQTPSAVALGVLVDTDLSIKAAGGFIIQMMPGSDPMLADLITYRLEEIPPLSELISKGQSIEEIMEYIFEGMELKILDSVMPQYRCDCSQEKVEKALISIGEKDLTQIYEEGKTEELKCHFCNKSYEFTNDSIGKILSLAKNKKE